MSSASVTTTLPTNPSPPHLPAASSPSKAYSPMTSGFASLKSSTSALSLASPARSPAPASPRRSMDSALFR